MPGGLVNLNLRVRLGDPEEEAVLRVYLRDAQAAPKEAAVLRRLEGRVPVARVLGSGSMGLTVHGAMGQASWLLLSLVPGQALSTCIDTLDEAALTRVGAEVGTALADLHTESFPNLGFLDGSLAVSSPMGSLCEVWGGYLGQMLQGERARGRLGGDRQARLVAFVGCHATTLAPLEGRCTLLHADCKPTNVFVRPDGELAGLLDWEFAWSGPALFDLGQLLRYDMPAAFEDALLPAYTAAGGDLPEDWRLQARLLDLMNLVGFLDMEAERPKQVSDVLDLIDAYFTAETA